MFIISLFNKQIWHIGEARQIVLLLRISHQNKRHSLLKQVTVFFPFFDLGNRCGFAHSYHGQVDKRELL